MACLLATPALAQEAGYSYGGLSVGQARAHFDDARMAASLLSGGLTTSATQRDDRDSGYKVFLGYQFNRGIALEAGYFNLGKYSFSSTTVPAGTLDGQIKLQGLNLDLVATLPLSERLSVLGRVGGQYAQTRDTFSGTGRVNVLRPNITHREANAKVGVGLQYEFSPAFLMRAEAERYRINTGTGDHGNVNLYSVSAVFPFGRAPTPVRSTMAAPAYVPPIVAQAAPPAMVVRPAPAPVVQAPPVVMAPPPPPRRVSLAAEALFGFDQANLQPQGKTALDAFAKDLAGARFDVVNVVGHTDRLGSTAYNQKLSQQRAEAVKAYLVSSGGLATGKVAAMGKGESTPVTRAGDCKGERSTPKLTACLQPDRRVDLEVTGTR